MPEVAEEVGKLLFKGALNHRGSGREVAVEPFSSSREHDGGDA